MTFDRWFRFVDDRLNNRLLTLLRHARMPFGVDENYRVYYQSQDEERFEDLLAEVRRIAFPSWQVLSSPQDWIPKYRQEMERRAVPYYEELNNGQTEFLLPRTAKPHSWRMS